MRKASPRRPLGRGGGRGFADGPTGKPAPHAHPFPADQRVRNAEDLENADFYLSDGRWRRLAETRRRRRSRWTSCWAREDGDRRRRGCPAAWTRASRGAEAIRLASLGAARPPYVYDNSEQIRATYEKALADYQAGRTAVLNTLTVASLFGGLGLVLLVAMLGVLRIGSGLHLWVPAVAAAACCLILGTILMEPGRLAPGYGAAVAFASDDAAEPKSVAAE